MKGKSTLAIALGTALAVLSVSPLPTSAQRRIVEDTSAVKVAKRAAKTITRGPRTVATARAATNGVLIVLTDPPAASIKINGQVAGKSDDQGEFTREMRAGAYNVEVLAGNEYVPFAQKVALTARGTEVVRAPLVSINASKFGSWLLSGTGESAWTSAPAGRLSARNRRHFST